MKNILLSNIGSRNLQIFNEKGDLVTIDDHIRDSRLAKYIDIHERTLREKYLFRNFTKDIWEKMQVGLPTIPLQLEILTSKVVGAGDYDELVLFYSDQEDERYNHQDTLYATKIIGQELARLIPGLRVDLRLISGNPTDENNLFSNYAKHAKELIEQHSADSLFAYLDAGATSQMKYASKIVFEYYLKQHHRSFKIQYISYLEDYSNNVERQLSQTYNTLDVASRFVSAFNFQAAYALFPQEQEDGKQTIQLKDSIKSLREHLSLAAHRLSFNGRRDAILPNLYPEVWARDYKNGKTPEGFLPYNQLQPSRADIFEIASICQHYFTHENYTLAVATYYRLCEELCQTYVGSQLNNTLNNRNEHDVFIKTVEPEVKGFFKGSVQYGLPLLLSWCVIDSEQRKLPVRNLFNAILPTVSYANGIKGKGLNELRNRCWLAHDNRAIDRPNIETEVPTFFTKNWPEFVKYLRLPAQNIFIQIQNSLLVSFQKV